MKKKIFTVLLLCFFLFLPSIINSQEYYIQYAFSLSLLSPNTSSARNQWSLLIEQQLPKIGISITLHESTAWGNIGHRTWSYPLTDYGYLPTYAEGGYDILFTGKTWDFDWDPTGCFDSRSIIPFGNNFYQYSNSVYDDNLDLYLTSSDPIERNGYLEQIRKILYDDLPSICLVYPRHFYVYRNTVSGIDFELLSSGNHRVEFWKNSFESIIRYAIPADFREPNIFVSRSIFDKIWMNSVYGSLLKRGQDDHFWEPIIARNYTIDPYGNSIIVDIDPNAKFSDNSSVLAEDVAYSYALHMNPNIKSPMNSILTKHLQNNSSIEVIDTDTIEFHLNTSYIFSSNLLSLGIIDKSTVEPLIDTYGYSVFEELPLTGNVNDSLVKSCGPFILEEFDPINSIVKLIPNPYWKELSAMEDNVLLEAFYIKYVSGRDKAISELIAGNVDLIDANYYPIIADFEGVSGIEGVLVKVPSYEEIAVNMMHPVIGTGELTPVGTAEAAKCIRKAISHAVPRQVIVDEILEGFGAPGITPYPVSVISFDQNSLEPYAYDIDLAIDYMEAAGYDILVYPEYTPYNNGKMARNFTLAFLGILIIPIVLSRFIVYIVKKNSLKKYIMSK